MVKKAIDGLSAPRPGGTAEETSASAGGGGATCTGSQSETGAATTGSASADGGLASDPDDATATVRDTEGTWDSDSNGNGNDDDTGRSSDDTRVGHSGEDSTGRGNRSGSGTHCGTPVLDPRSPANRRAHALEAALRGFLDAGLGPTQGGERPHITMVMNWDVVRGVVSDAGYDSEGAISAAQARKFLCDAQIIPAILGSKSEVLDIGRGRRTFPLAIRRAIALRDGGCVWPGCDRPPGWCYCHHVEWWHRDGGDTSYQGGVMFCPCHHTEIHKGEWTVRMGDDGIPELIPPKWMDPDQKPLRNNMHRPTEV